MGKEMKKVFSVVVLILILIAIPITVFVAKQQQELRQRAAPATTLTLTPSAITKKTGEEFTLDVSIDTAQNQVVVSDIHLMFDPEKLEALTITNSSLFPNIIASGVVDRGSASITVGVTDVKQPVIGIGTVATIRFKALAPTTSPISVRFSTNTFVGGIGEGSTNILVGSTPASVTITDRVGSANPTPTRTPPLTLSPSPSLRLTPTVSTSAQASASAVTIAPIANADMASSAPVFQGKAPPGSVVTITIYSTPKTATVSADANGNWVFTPQTALSPGQHTIVASITDNGITQTATATITVAGATPTPTRSILAKDVPASGNESLTLILVTLGTLLLAIGMVYPHLATNRNL